MRRREGDAVPFQHLAEKKKVTLEILEVVYRAQGGDPPSRWDQHQAAMRAAGKKVVETLELPEDIAEDGDE